MGGPLAGVGSVLLTAVRVLVCGLFRAIWLTLSSIGKGIWRHLHEIGWALLAAGAIAVAIWGGSRLLHDLKSKYVAYMENTKEERAFEDARDAANDSAEDLEIASRVCRILERSGGKLAMTVDGRRFNMRIESDAVVIEIDGAVAFEQDWMAREEPSVYRGVGTWEHLLDSAEGWIKQREVDAKFGGIPDSED